MKTLNMPEKGTDARDRLLAFMTLLENKREILNAEIDGVTISTGSEEYMVLTESEANERTTEYIKESLWAFNASFILSECGLDLSGEESLQAMQGKSCEDANPFILSLIEKTCGLDSFVDSAVSSDGRGHFLSPYDGNEETAEINGTTYYIYRIN